MLAVLNVPYSPFLDVSGGGRLAGRTRTGWTVVALDAPSDGRPRGLEIRGSLPWVARTGAVVSGMALLLGVLLILTPPRLPGQEPASPIRSSMAS